jgi:hypothetical protein
MGAVVYSSTMRSWFCQQAEPVVAACTWVLGATVLLGLLRLLPWLFRPEVPWSVVAPFAGAIGAKATETTMLLGLPAGCGLAAARVARTTRAATARLLVFPTALTLSLMFIGASWRTDASQPGRVAIGLLEQTRKSCRGVAEPRGAAVPMVGVSWLCFPGREPRVVGMLPGSGGKVWFSAAGLEAEPDLSGFALDDFRLSGDASPWFTSASLRVNHARVSGLPPWGRPAKLPVTIRSAILALSAWLIGAGVTMSHARLSLGGSLTALAAAGGPSLAVAAVLDRLDSSPAGAAGYAWLPVVAGVAVTLSTLLILAVSRRTPPRRFAGQSGG